jgi:predicted RNA-binding protein with PIN domain
MIIVIDGYNVLKQVITTHVIGAQECKVFITLLGRYAFHKKHVIVLVFDGGPHEWPHSERTAAVQVVYSGARQTADDYISSYLEKHKNQEIVLVSSDNELNSIASDKGIASIDSSSFYALFKDTINSDNNDTDTVAQQRSKNRANGRENGIVKLHNDSSTEFDEYMEQASQHVTLKQADIRISKIENARNKLARNDRRLLKIFKKL